MKRMLFSLVVILSMAICDVRVARAAQAPSSIVQAQPSSPMDPYINCGNYSYQPRDVIWQQCDAGYGPVYIQGQITTRHYDTYWGWHYNIVIQSAGGSRTIRNYHLTFNGCINNYYTWTLSDPNNGVSKAFVVSKSSSNAYTSAATQMASFIASDVGDSNLSTALLNTGGNDGGASAGQWGSLITAASDLMGYTPGTPH